MCMQGRRTIAAVLMCAVVSLAGCGTTGSHVTASETDAAFLEEAVTRLQVATPTYAAPVRLAAIVVPHGTDSGANATLIVKARIMAGWHIYAHVPPSQPFAQTSLRMDVPVGAAPVGEWAMPEPHSSMTAPDLLEYAGTVVFTHGLLIDEANAGDEVIVDIGFQACDMMGCLPPQTVTLRAAMNGP